ncbi:MAG: hypothetical protein GDA56_01010 [Hormoscilla sp. GM7CHS1pb]|nr:hypothetical protein [Hormoscilla sp. GM7CHS1pb]
MHLGWRSDIWAIAFWVGFQEAGALTPSQMMINGRSPASGLMIVFAEQFFGTGFGDGPNACWRKNMMWDFHTMQG